MAELLLSYYGDDLTGSTDVMEALASQGVPTVLFTQQPTQAQANAIRQTCRSGRPLVWLAHREWLRAYNAAARFGDAAGSRRLDRR